MSWFGAANSRPFFLGQTELVWRTMREWRVRQAELLARPHNASLLRDDPKVKEVVVVEPFHATTIRRFLLQLILKLPNSRRMGPGLIETHPGDVPLAARQRTR